MNVSFDNDCFSVFQPRLPVFVNKLHDTPKI